MKYLLILLLSISAQAELIWDKTKKSHNPSLTETISNFEFKFKNHGKSDITITKILSSCGCTSSQLEKKTYKPNETGVLKASINLKAISGVKVSTLKIYTNNSKSPSHTLTLKVTVPQAISIKPSFINWKKNNKRENRYVTINIHKDAKLTLDSFTFSKKSFRGKIYKADQGKTTLTITPPSKEDLKFGRVTCTLKFKDHSEQITEKKIYLFVY